MEDRHSVIEDFNAYLNLTVPFTRTCNHAPAETPTLQDQPRQAFFGVFDGHGGVEAAKFVEAQLPYNIGTHPLFKENVRA